MGRRVLPASSACQEDLGTDNLRTDYIQERTQVSTYGCRGAGPLMERTIQSGTGRQWKVIGAG